MFLSLGFPSSVEMITSFFLYSFWCGGLNPSVSKVAEKLNYEYMLISFCASLNCLLMYFHSSYISFPMIKCLGEVT